MTQLDPASRFIKDAAEPDSPYARHRKIYPKAAHGTYRNV
jgi:hypothetical protein